MDIMSTSNKFPINGFYTILSLLFSSICSGYVESSWRTQHVVPDVIDQVPPTTIHVTYPDGVDVVTGGQLSPWQTKTQPSISFPAKQTELHTLIMIDPDAPNPLKPTEAQFLHWLVINIPNGDLQRGDVIMSYSPPTPPIGVHRYIILVYQQDKAITVDEPVTKRNKFDAWNFANQYNLKNLVAGNFFTVEASKHDSV